MKSFKLSIGNDPLYYLRRITEQMEGRLTDDLGKSKHFTFSDHDVELAKKVREKQGVTDEEIYYSLIK